MRLKVTLGDVVLGVGKSEYQYLGYGFDPEMLKSASSLCDENLVFGFNIGDGRYVSLYFEPIDKEHLKIYVNKEMTNLKKIGFDINKVPEVILKRKDVKKQFDNVYGKIVTDSLRLGLRTHPSLSNCLGIITLKRQIKCHVFT